MALRSETIDIPTADGVADAYLTRRDAADGDPAVLLLMDAFGLRPRIEEMADRVARRGHVVLAPNLFYRAGRAPVIDLPDLRDPEQRAGLIGVVRPLMEQLGAPEVASDGAAYLAVLAEHAPGPVALTGYCMGVRVALRIAAAHPERVAALGGFHGGGLVTDAPDSPHRCAGEVRAEVYLGHADEDHSNTPEQIAALDAALDAAGVAHTTEVYAGAPHGYTMSDTASYEEAACERHFEALFALLGRTLTRAA